MNFPNDILNNREIAIIIWMGLFIVWAVSQKAIRNSLVNVLKAFTKIVIFVPFLLMMLYIGMMIYLLYKIHFWEISNLSDTILWLFGVAIVMFVNLNRAREEGFFKKAVLDSLKLIIILEFVINLYVFNLWVELIFVPVLVVIGLMLGVSSTDSKYKQVESLLTWVMGFIGIGLILFTLYKIIADLQGFASIDNIRDFLLPPLFTVGLLPFIYLIALYVTYDLIFMRTEHSAMNASLAKYAKRKTFFAFHLNLVALNKWLKRVVMLDFNSREDIVRAIKEFKASGS